MKTRETLAETIRELVAAIYYDCKGAYGSECGYSGQYEQQIQRVVDALAGQEDS